MSSTSGICVSAEASIIAISISLFTILRTGDSQDPRIEDARFTGFEIYLDPVFFLEIVYEFDETLYVVVITRYVVAAAKIDPFQSFDIWAKELLERFQNSF